MKRSLKLTAVERLLGSEPKKIGSVIQIIVALVLLLILNQVINDMLSGWRERVYPSTTEIYERLVAYFPYMPADWMASVRHLLIGILGVLPGFLIGTYVSLYRKAVPVVLLFIAAGLSYSKLVMSVDIFLLTQNKELTIYIFGWWVSGLYGAAISYFTARKIITGQHLLLPQAMLDIATLYFPTRWKLYKYYLLPHCLSELPFIMSVSSAAIFGSFLFTEALVQVPGLGTKGMWAADTLDMATLQVVAVTLMLTNVLFWLGFNFASSRFNIIGMFVARCIDKSFGK